MHIFYLIILILGSCVFVQAQNTRLIVLGVAQDAGYPQAGCEKQCCKDIETVEYATSIAIVQDSNYILFEATPGIKYQLRQMSQMVPEVGTKLPLALFITHAHIGHYTGLMHFGREVMGTNNQTVYVMPKMKSFLENNGPWSQLVELNNISLKQLIKNQKEEVMNQIQVEPIQVPHRDEYSETVGFIISSENKKALFIPDIDKWKKWEINVDSLIKEVDVAFLDGTFFSNGELPGRDMSEIPHPFVTESMQRFDMLSEKDRAKIYFIHFNHTNPLIWDKEAKKEVEEKGYNVAFSGLVLDL